MTGYGVDRAELGTQRDSALAMSQSTAERASPQGNPGGSITPGRPVFIFRACEGDARAHTHTVHTCSIYDSVRTGSLMSYERDSRSLSHSLGGRIAPYTLHGEGSTRALRGIPEPFPRGALLPISLSSRAVFVELVNGTIDVN